MTKTILNNKTLKTKSGKSPKAKYGNKVYAYRGMIHGASDKYYIRVA